MDEESDGQTEQEIDELINDIAEIMGGNFRRCDCVALANGLYKRNYRKINSEAKSE